VLAQVAEQADVLLLCGDLTDYGTVEEARVLVKELAGARLPTVAILGNHDYESGTPRSSSTRCARLASWCSMASRTRCTASGFAGVKGFCGGFGRAVLGAWGEGAVKAFVQEAVHETLKLETALARLRTRQKIALLHYAPIRATVEGEPVEIFPWLGCGRTRSRSCATTSRRCFTATRTTAPPRDGSPMARPCYNVALPLMRQVYPDQLPVRIITVDPDAEPHVEGEDASAYHGSSGGAAGASRGAAHDPGGNGARH
jgi:hypothetical protein